MPTETSDADLVRRIAASPDPAAESELLRRIAPRIRLYGLRHLRDPHAAEDLMQHVLIKTLEALRAGRLRDPEKFPAFVLGTCRMAVLDIRRGTHRRDTLLTRFQTDIPAPTTSPEPALDRHQLARCVQGLNERERAVIVMTFYDEQSGADLAGLLRLSESNVRVIRHRAIHQLRACMGVAA